MSGTHVLVGDDLIHGGEGMHEFYDNLLPRRLQKIVGPLGGKVEKINTNGDPVELLERKVKFLQSRPPMPSIAAQREFDSSIRSAIFERDQAMGRADRYNGWMVRLTPELKAKILKMGLPFMAGVAATQPDDQTK